MALKLPPTPVGVPPGHSFWNDWYEKLRNMVNNSQIAVLWSNINFSGSNLTDLATREHNNLQSLQGGTPGEYYHLTSSQANDLPVSGTWTPVLVGVTTAGTGTYTIQDGKYTKIGDVVHLYGSLTWTAHTGTGVMRISGLPYTCAKRGPLASRFSDITYTGTTPYVASIPSSTQLQIAQFSSGAAASDMTLDTAGSIAFQGIYFV